MPAPIFTCRLCGQPAAEAENGVCLACRLRPGLPTAGEIYAQFLAHRHLAEPGDFEGICASYPELAEELRRLHAAGRSVPTSAASASPPGPEAPLAREASAADQAGASQAPGEPSDAATGKVRGGRYEVRGVVARGGMGIIYAVWDRELNRQIAMKVIGTSPAGVDPISLESLPPAWVDRFVEEAQITAQLDHPHIVPVHEIGVDPQGRLYFTMKLVKGRALNEVFTLARGKAEGWNLARAVSVLVRACEAVAHAHEHGVVHRDLKPQNILVARLGEVYVMDWGLARHRHRADLYNLRPAIRPPVQDAAAGRRTTTTPEAAGTNGSPLATVDGTVLGTPAYMSPEHAQGRVEDIGPASDVYALGAILYELLAGHPPYLGPGEKPTPKAVLEAVRAGPPEPLGGIARGKPAELLAICAKAMNREAVARYPDAAQLAEDLQAWLDGRVVRAHRTGALAELKAWILRNRLAAFSQAAGVTLIVGILLGVTFFQQRANRLLSQEVYASVVGQAAQRLQAGEHGAAGVLLHRAQPEHRGWEWRHLMGWARSWETATVCREPPGLATVAVSAARDWFVTAGPQQPLRLRSLSDGREIASFGRTNATLLAADPTGGLVVAAAGGDEVAAWELPSGRLRGRWALESEPQVLAFARTEPDFAIGASDGSVRVFSLERRDPIATASIGAPVTALAFARGGVLFVGDAAGVVRKWDFGGTNSVIEVGRQLGRVIAMGTDGDGTRLVTAAPRLSRSAGLRLWNIEEAWTFDLPVPAGFSDLWATVFDTSERHLLACSYFGSLLIADLNTGRLDAVVVFDGRAEAEATFLDSDGTILSWDRGGEVVRLTRRQSDHVQLAGPPGQLRTIRFADGGELLRVASFRGEIQEWRIASRSLVRRLSTDGLSVKALDATHQGARLVAGCGTGTLFSFDLGTGAVQQTIRTADPPADIWWLDISPDDGQVAVGCADGTLRILDLQDWQWVGRPIAAHQREVEGVRFSPDGTVLGTCGNDGGVKLWRTSDWQPLWHQDRLAGKCRTVEFSPDGQRLVHGNSDGSAHVRSVRDGRLLLPPLAGHRGRVMSAAYSPDGTRLYTGAEDGTVKVWDANTGLLLVTLPVTTLSPVWEVAVSPDGTRVAAADGEGTVTVWFGEGSP